MAEIARALSSKSWAMSASAGDDPIMYSARDFRRILYGLFYTEGILHPTFLEVKQRAAGADFSIDVAAGDAIVFGVPGGQYYAWSDNTENIKLDEYKNPTAARTHKVFLSIFDKLEGSTDHSGPKIVVTEDTGLGAPTPTGTPAANLLLAEVKVAPGQSSIATANIVNKRPYALLRNDMQRPPPVVPAAPFAMQSGQINANPYADWHNGPYRVNFTTGRFSAVPRVFVCQSSINAGGSHLICKADNIHTTYFDCWVYYSPGGDIDGSAANYTIDWFAVQAG